MGEIDTMKANKKMWVGKTPRQWLVEGAALEGSLEGFTANDAVNVALEKMSDCPPSTPGALVLQYWNACSTSAQIRIIREVRRKLRYADYLMGRRLER